MTQRPILFSAPMVRALLDGNNTQTRRVCKPAEAHALSCVVEVPDPLERGQVYNGSHLGYEEGGVQFGCPYGGVGDRLWVRESWAYNPDLPGVASRACFMADSGHNHNGLKWKPSIHMPRAVCRTVLEITGVRVERLQAISDADAKAEGISEFIGGWICIEATDEKPLQAGATPQEGFRHLWEQINGAGRWAANPWVWVVEFKKGTP